MKTLKFTSGDDVGPAYQEVLDSLMSQLGEHLGADGKTDANIHELRIKANADFYEVEVQYADEAQVAAE